MKTPLFACLLGLAASPASSQINPLERCRAIEAPAERLACYDAMLPPRVAAAAPVPSPSATTPVDATASAKGGTQNHTVSQGAPNAAAAPGAGVGSRPAANPPANFGFESRRRATDEASDRVVSAYQGIFGGWGPAEKIPLANGQVWQIADDSQTAYDIKDPVIRIVRGAFGSFFMEIEGVSHSPKVRRVK